MNDETITNNIYQTHHPSANSGGVYPCVYLEAGLLRPLS